MNTFEKNIPYDADNSVSEALKFAEKGWKEASQANFCYEVKLRKVSEKYKQLSSENKRLKQDIETWRTAYDTVVNSKTWKMASKLKMIIGKNR